MEKPLISIIIPVYNVEDLIEECVVSCTNQTYENIEIVLVDDGSLDGSGEKCDILKAGDDRIKVYHTKNQGVAETRNYGLIHSNGEYIAFVDGDDTIASCYIEKLYNLLIETNADMAGCRFYRNNKEDIIFPSSNDSYDFLVNGVTFLKKFYNDFGVFAPAWGKLAKRTVWEDIKFPTKSIAEDVQIIRPLALKCNLISWTQEAMYFYRNRECSISQTADKRKVSDSIEWIEDDINYYDCNNMRELKYIAYKAYCFAILETWWRIPDDQKATYRKHYVQRAFGMLFHRGNKFLAKIKYLVYIRKLV